MDPFKNASIKAGGNASQLIEFPDFYLLDVLEGLGSLNKLADEIYDSTGQSYYYQAAWGNAASILNDLSCFGAKPLTLKLFIAVGNEAWFLHKKRYQDFIRGFRDAAKFADVSWNGGETQTLVDIIHPKSFVLAGSATGIIKPKKNLLSEAKIQAGDRIILLESSGVHTNGITLIRKLFKKSPEILVEAIKSKTIIYSPLIDQLQAKNIEVHYASHITGHGWRKIMRPQAQFSYIIEKIPKPQPIFKKIQEATKLTDAQMYGDYNMGCGLALIVPKKSVEITCRVAHDMSIKAVDAGFVEAGPRKVIIKPLEIEFLGDSLQIR
jgi:phosphoribosylformylglycinamidine cyclo-ligase